MDQFEQHLRAVLGLPLGDCQLRSLEEHSEHGGLCRRMRFKKDILPSPKRSYLQDLRHQGVGGAMMVTLGFNYAEWCLDQRALAEEYPGPGKHARAYSSDHGTLASCVAGA